MVQIMQLKNGQRLVTIPQKIADAYRLEKGTKVKFEFMFKQGKIISLKLTRI